MRYLSLDALCLQTVRRVLAVESSPAGGHLQRRWPLRTTGHFHVNDFTGFRPFPDRIWFSTLRTVLSPDIGLTRGKGESAAITAICKKVKMPRRMDRMVQEVQFPQWILKRKCFSFLDFRRVRPFPLLGNLTLNRQLWLTRT